MEQHRIHWNNAAPSEWMGGEALYNAIWRKEAFVLYIESMSMQPHLNNVVYLMQHHNITAMSKDGELLSYIEDNYHIGGKPVEEWEVRAALQARYTNDPDDYIEDKDYTRNKLESVFSSI